MVAIVQMFHDATAVLEPRFPLANDDKPRRLHSFPYDLLIREANTTFAEEREAQAEFWREATEDVKAMYARDNLALHASLDHLPEMVLYFRVALHYP
jgi:hypothetical protein